MRKFLLILFFIPLLYLADTWPIKVSKIEKNRNKLVKEKWMITTENGVVYYTNHKPKIGDIAFCIDDYDNIVKCNNKKK